MLRELVQLQPQNCSCLNYIFVVHNSQGSATWSRQPHNH